MPFNNPHHHYSHGQTHKYELAYTQNGSHLTLSITTKMYIVDIAQMKNFQKALEPF